ncbi:other/FunK1 protein kinase [Coprinopsis cinerea AmutBmut pab1-1]|nr:other/FunK1 protein kinase [Coprinopsis cinerea AmutBmut pab1-1]
MKTLQTIGTAVRKALGRVTKSEVNNCSMRLEDNAEYIAHGCITSNSEGPLRLTDVVVPIMGVDSRDVHPLSDEVDVVLLSHVAQIMNGDARRRFCFAVCCRLTPSRAHQCRSLTVVITTLGEAVDVLRQALIPLRLMFCAGWVHRDVSPGNILAYRQAPGSPWTVKLSDLEHAQKFPDPESTGGDRITGTPYFIACEVLDGDYLSLQEQDEDSTDDDDPDMSPPPHEFVPVCHNFQHDLESIFWILLWLISMRINQKMSRAFGERHFQQRVDGGYASIRCRALASNLLRQVDLVKSLPQALLHSRFLRHLNTLRKNLYGQYIARNNDGKYNDISTYSWIASVAFDSFFDEVEARRDEWAGIEVVGNSTTPRRALAPANKSTTICAADAPPSPSPSPPNEHQQYEGKPSRKRPVADSAEGGRAQKRARKNPERDDIVVPRRSGPTTRSMAMSERRVTRSTTRRLEEEKKKRRLK